MNFPLYSFISSRCLPCLLTLVLLKTENTLAIKISRISPEDRISPEESFQISRSPFPSPSPSLPSSNFPSPSPDNDVHVQTIISFELVNIPNDEEFTIENCNILEIVVNNWLRSYFDNTSPSITDIEASVQKHILTFSQSSVRRKLKEKGSLAVSQSSVRRDLDEGGLGEITSSLFVEMLVTGGLVTEPGLFETAIDAQFDVKVKKYFHHVVPNRKLLQNLRSARRNGYYSNVNDVVLIEGDIQDYIIYGPAIPSVTPDKESPSSSNIVVPLLITSLAIALFVGGMYIFEVGRRYKYCGGCNWSARPKMSRSASSSKSRDKDKSEVLTDPSSIISGSLSSGTNQDDHPVFPVPVPQTSAFNIFAPISTSDRFLDDDHKSTNGASVQSYDYSLESGLSAKLAVKERQQKTLPDLKELAINSPEGPERRPFEVVRQRSEGSTLSSLTDKRSLKGKNLVDEDIPLTIREQVERYRRAKQAQRNQANEGDDQNFAPDISTIVVKGNNVDDTSLLSDTVYTMT